MILTKRIFFFTVFTNNDLLLFDVKIKQKILKDGRKTLKNEREDFFFEGGECIIGTQNYKSNLT